MIYTLLFPIDKDGGGQYTQLDISRPTMTDINSVTDYWNADNYPREIYLARLLMAITTPALSLAEAGRLDLADCRALLGILSKL